MKLQMMTHGSPNQCESDGDVMPFYQSPHSSPRHQHSRPQISQPCFSGSHGSPAVAEYLYSASSLPATSSLMLPENHNAAMSNEDLLRVAEEQLSPLIKEELRHTIQCKRVAKGLSAHVEIEYKSPQSEPESPDILLKRQRRRNRNKVAAARCRFKKKILSEKLIEESEKLEIQNQQLKVEAQRLQDERQKLVFILNLHRPTCIVRNTPYTYTTVGDPVNVTQRHHD